MTLSFLKGSQSASVRVTGIAILLLVFAPGCHAQASTPSKAAPDAYSMDKNGESMVLVDGFWRFHPKDDSLWADPAFDDSQWPLARADKSWNEQGYRSSADC